MNILILSWRGSGHPSAGGAEIATLNHAIAWAKLGHMVTLFTSFYSGAVNDEIIDGVRIIRRGNAEVGVRVAACCWYLFGDHRKFDVVIDEFHGIPFFTPLFVRTKKLGFIHEVAKEVWFLNYKSLKAWIGYLLEPWVFKLLYQGVSFMTVSKSTKKDLVQWGIKEKNIHVIHNGINVIIPKQSVKKDKLPVVTFVGALQLDKGIEEALKIFAILHKQYQKIHFWVIGKGSKEYIDDLKSKARILHIAKYLHFWGYVSEEKKYELLKRSHILINPSAREGWGLVVIEAAAMSTPTVGYDVPGLRDSIQDGVTGLLSRPNPQDAADKIISLLEDPKKLGKMQKSAFNWASQFTWKKSTQQSLELLKKLV